MIRNAVTLERERKQYERTTKLQEKEYQELLDRKRRKPISVRCCCNVWLFVCASPEHLFVENWILLCFTTASLTLFFSFIQIQVQILTGRKIVIYIDPLYDQLIDIKKKIQVKEGIHPDQMILFYNGIRLQENSNKTLDDVLYISHHQQNVDDSGNIKNICLFLTLRNRGGWRTLI